MKASILGTGRVLLSVLSIAAAAPQPAPTTTITVSNTVAVPSVNRFGMQMSDHLYYDRVVLKNLAWHNAGFEALQYQTVIRCGSGTPTGCVDDNPNTAWPTGFMNGASYEFILGAAKGRTGTVASFVTAPRDNVTGSSYTFEGPGVAPAAGDYFVVKKYMPGGADTGWNPVANNGATITTETVDLPPGTDGRQCIRLTASSAGQFASIATAFGSFANQTFLVMNGAYRMTFKAKGIGGANAIAASVARGATQFTNQSVPLTSAWATYTLDFSAAESGIPSGFVALMFTASGSSALIDDVSLVQINSDPSNTTDFRDPVIAALRTYNPGMLRSPNKEQGESLENLIGPPFGHIRAGYTVYGTSTGIEQYGWQEFLGLCEFLHAEPYIVIPITFSNTEIANLMEWLGGAATTPFGARRAARGHAAPWTDAFPRIHLEYANEAWNALFRGATMLPADFGARGHDVFGVVRQSPYYSAKFNLILGVQTANPFNTRATHNASANHDMLAIAPYIATRIDDFESNERLFGGLFAEASWWSVASGGFIKLTADFINATPRPVPLIVYEVNLHTTEGSITQPVLDAFAPSIGAGLAVADHMLIMLREFKIRDQALFALGGYRYDRQDGKTSLIWGVTRDMGVTDRKRPQYLALQLVNEALAGGGDMVGTTQSGEDPHWDQPLTNRIALNDVPYIQSFAFVNGVRRGVVVFNLHRTSALQVDFAGPNAPSGAVTMRRLTATAITDTNEDAETVSIQTTAVPSFDPSQPLTLPPFSMTVLIAEPAAAVLPGPPVNVIAIGGDRSATVSFGAPASDGGAAITGYAVAASPGGGICTWTSGPLACLVTGLTNGTTYTFTVRATNAIGTGPASSPSNPVTPAPPPPAPGDFDGNGTADLAVFRPATGVWFILGQPSVQWGLPGDIPVPGDYDGDGVTDAAVFRPGTGHWFVRGQPALQWGAPGDVPVPGDYDGDGRVDAAVYRAGDGGIGTWFVRGRPARSWGVRGDIPVAGDFDGDGQTDLVVFRPSIGTWFVATSSSGFGQATATQFGMPGDVPLAADVDGDRRADMVVFRPSIGTWFVSGSSRGTFEVPFGLTGDVPLLLDVSGDGVADFCVWRPGTGVWYTFDRARTGTVTSQPFGLAGDIPAMQRPRLPSAPAADFDGDGRADLTIFRDVGGVEYWYQRLSRTGYATNAVVQWGLAGDINVPGDYDGDRVTDVAVFRPSNGAWYITPSASTTPRQIQFGLNGDIPVPGDYDGDGRTDPAVFRPAGGYWFALLSSTDFTQFIVDQWGAPGDVPLVGDFDGDGKADFTVFQPSTGTWRLKLTTTWHSADRTLTRPFGLPGDRPVASDFDGDGRTDLGVYRGDGTWLAADAVTGLTIPLPPLGLSSDLPVARDYDGDGVADLAVFRPATGTWFIRASSGGLLRTYQWGLPGDRPALRR